MKIVGFGDSFITVCKDDYGYTNLVAKHFNGEFESYAYAGSGTWDAYFQLEKYLERNPNPDIVLCAWSASGRLFHPEIRDLCYNSVVLNRKEAETPAHNIVYDAAMQYYEHLHHVIKADMEHACLYYWIDKELTPKYPNTKFINMWSFPKKSCDFSNPNEMEYLYEFTNSVELRPALIHLSYIDEWPKDLGKEHRVNHLTPKMHKVLADNIIHAIENYNPGLLNIKL